MERRVILRHFCGDLRLVQYQRNTATNVLYHLTPVVSSGFLQQPLGGGHYFLPFVIAQLIQPRLDVRAGNVVFAICLRIFMDEQADVTNEEWISQHLFNFD